MEARQRSVMVKRIEITHTEPTHVLTSLTFFIFGLLDILFDYQKGFNTDVAQNLH